MFDITLRKAGLSYGDHVVFDHLDLVLRAQHWTCLLGPNGVGKSSLLRRIAGLDNGRDCRSWGDVCCTDGQPLKGRVSWFAQNDQLLPWGTVLDNITLAQRLEQPFWQPRSRLPTSVTERAFHLLEQLGLADKAKSLPQTLSGGEQQRVTLARVLMEDRPVILMDEPFSALDVVTRLDIHDVICTFLVNRTVILITHDPLEALRLGHFIYHLRGSPARLTEPLIPQGRRPRSPHDSEIIALQGVLFDRYLGDEKNV